jgi:hypothetical protein
MSKPVVMGPRLRGDDTIWAAGTTPYELTRSNSYSEAFVLRGANVPLTIAAYLI